MIVRWRVAVLPRDDICADGFESSDGVARKKGAADGSADGDSVGPKYSIPDRKLALAGISRNAVGNKVALAISRF